MKNMIDICKDFGIEIPADKHAEFNKAVAENYKTVAEHEKKVNRLTDDLNAEKKRADTAEETLKGFEGIDPTKVNEEISKWKKQAEEAQQNVAAWKSREKQNYQVSEEDSVTLNDRDYTLLTMSSGSEDNPYGFGMAAFTVSGTNAICVELVCSDTFAGDPWSLMEEFLGGLHFSE
jgi:DNA repair exonuclease SbcCD ATPase subunit